ncbi:glycosyltransferase [Chromatocurvus halotolerans]|nr:glycosyltransferase [Chromatocurvus halotolerans]
MLEKLRDLGVKCDPSAGESLFNPDMQHSTAVDQAAARLQSFEQTLLAEYCDALCAGGPLTPLPAPTTSLHEKIRDFAAALAPLADALETRQRLDEARALSQERTAERDRLLAEWEQLDASHNQLAVAHEQEVENHRATIAQRDSLIADLEISQTDLAQRDHELAEMADKTNYLFHELSQAYTHLLTYEQSSLARVNRWATGLYKLVTGQRRENSRYDDVLANARQYIADNALEMPEVRPGKLAMLGNVLCYMASNPAGSLRSISWPRIRRGFSVFFGSSAADLQVWIDARFPEQAKARMALDPTELSPGLDNLELEFPAAESPQVSIVVPVFNDYRVTVHCLQSLLRHSPAGQYEVILADDGSTDLTGTIESRIRGIQVVRGGNLGFLRNCNRAAEQARGDFVLMLNNDTAVTAGWLQALLDVFEDPEVGAAGPKLVFANGALQEAGGIMWRDASAWNFGRMDDAAKPAYSYVKDVDYISGACLMLRRCLWEKLGGFDERFVPAYYEDADICFAVREAGYRVVYQPAACIFHFEGVSNGTDLTSGVKQHQITNQQVFADKWQAVLERDHYPNAEHVIWARDRSAHKPCVLFIDHYVPHYDKDAGSRSTFMYVKLLLSMGYRVQFMGANFFAHSPYTEALQQLGVEVLVGESIARGLDAWLAEHAPYINQIFLHRPHVAEQFLPHLKKLASCPPINFVGHDLHYLRIGREAELQSDPALQKSADSWRQREFAVFDQVDRIYYFSQAETYEIARHRPDLALRTIPLHALEDKPLPSYAPIRPTHLLFVGGFNHPPNVDAARWFVEEILPQVSAAVPDCHFHLVGSNPNSAVKALATDNVTVHGYVDDVALDALYRDVGLAVVPLRYGAGVKGKVLEAVQQNVPLVTTHIGTEGIPDADAVMWIADDAQAIAETVVGLLNGSINPADRMARYGGWLEQHFSSRRAEALLRVDFEGGP